MKQSKEQPTIMVRGKTYPVKAGSPFMKTIAERIEAAKLENVLVRMTDPVTSDTTTISIEEAPELITQGMRIEIAPYDQAGRQTIEHSI